MEETKRVIDPSRRCLIQEIATWNQNSVELYLSENGIKNCENFLTRNHIDGQKFLTLSRKALMTSRLDFIQQTRILSLLSSIGCDSERKEIVEEVAASNRICFNDPVKQTAFPIPSANTLPKPYVPTPIASTGQPVSSRPKSQIIKRPNGPVPVPPPKPKQLQSASVDSKNGFPASQDTKNVHSSLLFAKKTALHEEEQYLVPNMMVESDAELNEYIDDFSSEESSSIEDDDDGELYEKPTPTVAVNSKKSIIAQFRRMLDPATKQNDTSPIVPQKPVSLNCSTGSLDSQVKLNPSTERRDSPTLPPQRKISNDCPPVTPPALPPANKANGRRLSPSQPNHPGAFQESCRSPFTPTLTPVMLCNSTESSRNPSPTPSTSSSSNESEVSSKPWFFSIDRKKAEICLQSAFNGTFLIRPSKHGGDSAQYTLSLAFNRRVFHILVRRRSDHKYALGTEKKGEDAFYSLIELVDYYRSEPMQLNSGSEIAGTTRLLEWPDRQWPL